AEESPHKKRKTCPAPSPIWLLPEEMVLSCISRVSRSDQAALSLVSRSYRFLGKYGSSDVFHLDCKTHTWRQVPSMGVGRVSAAVGVVGGKIYVFRGCWDDDSSKWAEEEKVYAVDLMERSLYYSPSESKWGRGNHSQVRGKRRDWCVIDNIIYSCDCLGDLCWCEQNQLLECSEPEPEREGMYWKKVQGLGSLKQSLSSSRLVHFDGRYEALWEARKIGFGSDHKLIDLLPGARLCKFGSNLVLFWDVIEGDRFEIWCAEISLERRQGAEIWGYIEWSHPVMTVEPFLHRRYKVLHSVSVTL
ncbi:hypothetical protein EUTSA_v10005688mg, partial [Eutrema salsugineum]